MERMHPETLMSLLITITCSAALLPKRTRTHGMVMSSGVVVRPAKRIISASFGTARQFVCRALDLLVTGRRSSLEVTVACLCRRCTPSSIAGTRQVGDGRLGIRGEGAPMASGWDSPVRAARAVATSGMPARI